MMGNVLEQRAFLFKTDQDDHFSEIGPTGSVFLA
jgi:hypothetical protein